MQANQETKNVCIEKEIKFCEVRTKTVVFDEKKMKASTSNQKGITNYTWLHLIMFF